MFVLWQNDGISIRELAKKTALKKSTMTSMLERLEKSGYLKRIPSKKDHRKILVMRTAKDMRMEKEYSEISQKMNDLTFSGFSEEEIKHFEQYLRRILSNLAETENKKSFKDPLGKIQ